MMKITNEVIFIITAIGNWTFFCNGISEVEWVSLTLFVNEPRLTVYLITHNMMKKSFVKE